jgi:hypothetical protein
VALAESRLRTAQGAVERNAAWLEVRTEVLPEVQKFIKEAEQSLQKARKALGSFRLGVALAKYRFEAMLSSSNSPSGSDGAKSAPILKLLSRRGRRTPLGYGDLTFMLSTAGAAIMQLSYTTDRAIYLFDDSEDTLIGDDELSLKLAQDYLERLVLDTEFDPPFAGPLLATAGMALVNVENALARHRLSQAAMRMKAKIYLLRAAIYIGHVGTVDRSETMECLVIPDSKRSTANSERNFSLLMARSCINTAGNLLKTARSLRKRDIIWRILRADLQIRLGRFDILQRYDHKLTSRAIVIVDARLRNAESRISAGRC